MKRSILLLALSVILAGGVQAQKNSKRPGKRINPVILEPTKVDTLEEVDSKTYSVALGIQEGGSLRQYLMNQRGVDGAYVDKAAAAMLLDPNTPEAKEIMAKAAGLEIARIAYERIRPTVNKENTGSEDGNYLDMDLFVKTLRDMTVSAEVPYTADSVRKILAKQKEYASEQYKKRNEKWLAENALKDSVVTTGTGLQYKILRQGEGPVASDTSHIEVNYEGRLIDGTVFDSSFKRGESVVMQPTQVILGFRQALTLMPEGSRWEIYIPASLGYGADGAGPIPANSTLIFILDTEKVNTARRD